MAAVEIQHGVGPLDMAEQEHYVAQGQSLVISEHGFKSEAVLRGIEVRNAVFPCSKYKVASASAADQPVFFGIAVKLRGATAACARTALVTRVNSPIICPLRSVVAGADVQGRGGCEAAQSGRASVSCCRF
ncbi:MAG: hypothetical protein ACI9U6_000106 [Loktanella salsilacus]|jgi:hypothetical protein